MQGVGKVAAVQRYDGRVGFDNHTVGADGLKKIGHGFGSHGVADADGPGGKRGQQHVGGFGASENVSPGPDAQRRGEAGRVQEIVPLVGIEPVVAGADGGQVCIPAALQEVAGIRHAILERDALLAAGAGHVVEKGFAGVQIAAERGRVSVDAVEPVLLISGHAGRFEVSGNVVPPLRVHRRHARKFIALMIRTRRVNPTGVGDQRQADGMLKGCQALRKKEWMRLVFQRSAVTIPFAFGQLARFSRAAGFAVGVGGGFGIPPTVQLQIADGNLFLAIPFHERLERAGVSLVQVVIVVIKGAVVGPVTQIFQDGISVIGRTSGLFQFEERPAPQIPRLVDARAEGDQGFLGETRRQIAQAGIEAAGHPLPAITEHAGNHKMGRRRNDEGIGVVVKQEPRRARLAGGELRRGKSPQPITEHMQVRRHSREIGEGGRRRSGCRFAGLGKKRQRRFIVKPDPSGHGDFVRLPLETDLLVGSHTIAAAVGSHPGQRGRDGAGKSPGQVARRNFIKAIGRFQPHRETAARCCQAESRCFPDGHPERQQDGGSQPGGAF